MNTVFSEEYYINNSEKLEAMRGVIKPEADLEHELSIFAELPDEAKEKLVFIYARKVAERIEVKLLEDKQAYINVRKNSSCLGYTTKIQETQEAGRITRTFEYNCYKLSQFKKKYSL